MGTRAGNAEYCANTYAAMPLSERIYRGDKAAESEMISQHSEVMLRSIVSRVRNAHTANDLLHDSLLAALVVLRTRPLSEPNKLIHYLLRIAKFQTANHLRCKHLRMVTHAHEDLESLTDERGPGPLQAYLQWREHQSMRQSINSLGVARDRLLATRFYLEEESKRHICSDMDITAANFDRIVYRLKQRLQKLMVIDVAGSAGVGG